MSKQLYLQVPEPCHENWTQMTPADKGRHCNACSKVVVDFSIMSDRQIIDYFAKATHKTCGHFTADQLNRPIIKPKEPLKYLKYLWQILIPAMLVSCGIDTGKKKQTISGKAAVEKIEKWESYTVGELALPRFADTFQPPLETFNSTGVCTIEGDVIPFDMTGTVSMITPDIEEKPVTDSAIKDSVKIIGQDTLTTDSTANEDATTVKYVVEDSTVLYKFSITDTLKSYIRELFDTSIFKIYPNPLNPGKPLYIQFLKAGNYQVQVFDNAGRLHTAATYNNIIANQTVNLNLSPALAKGIYYIRCIDVFTQQQFTNKVMVN